MTIIMGAGYRIAPKPKERWAPPPCQGEDEMAERPRFFDDIAGVAGGALSALAGIREEAEAMVRARVDETIRKLDLVRRSDMDAVQELAANARAGQEAAEARVAGLEARLAALEERVVALEAGRGAAEMHP
jgi:BMFP domain-containing protein YqiC